MIIISLASIWLICTFRVMFMIKIMWTVAVVLLKDCIWSTKVCSFFVVINIYIYIYIYAGTRLKKIFATTKVLQVKQALLPGTCEKFFKFSIAICINCIGKMPIWGHFHMIRELLLNNYLGHFLIIEKTFVFLCIKSAIKPTPMLHANVSVNQSHQSPLWKVACWSFQSTIYTSPTGVPKGFQAIAQLWIVN